MVVLSPRDLLTRCYSRLRGRVKRVWLDPRSPRMVSSQTLPESEFLGTLRLRGEAPTREALLAHMRSRVSSAWPATPAIIRDLRINTDKMHSEEVVALADSILARRFVLRMQSPEVTPLGSIAWHVSPTTDPEWLWALHRHQWWPVLGLAYGRTGDERYAAAFVSEMVDWVRENPPPARKDERSPSWRLMEVGLRMRVSWIPCFAQFYESSTFTDDAKMTMLRAIYDHARFLLLFRTNRNHFLRESNGLVHVGVSFPEFREADSWRQAAIARLDGILDEQLFDDGVHFEVSTGYQSMVIDEFQSVYDLLSAHVPSLLGDDLAYRLEKMYQVLAHVVRPDGTFPYVNDGSFYFGCDQLARAGEALGRDDFVYVGTNGSRGSAPADTSAAFDDGGLYVMRSDWSPDARYLMFNAGPYGGPHGHEDKLSIELFAFGQPFIVDSNAYTYDKADPYRGYFVSSQAHNTVLVDGQSQVRRWQKDSLHPSKAAFKWASWISQPMFDYVSASYGDGYGQFRMRRSEGDSVIKDVVHTRRVLFVKPDYWVIVDELVASSRHEYQVLFHTVPGVEATAGVGNAVILGTGARAPALHIVPAEFDDGKVRWLVGSEDPLQGWYSPGTGKKTPAAVVMFERGDCTSTVITTLLYPSPPDRTDDTVTIEPLSVSKGEGLAYIVTTHRGQDALMVSGDDGPKSFGPYESEGVVAGIRSDHRGRVFARFEGRKRDHPVLVTGTRDSREVGQ